MTGPEHYREAERLLSSALLDDEVYDTRAIDHANITAAQVHATLAQAAATALGSFRGGTTNSGTHMPFEDGRAWKEVAGVQPS